MSYRKEKKLTKNLRTGGNIQVIKSRPTHADIQTRKISLRRSLDCDKVRTHKEVLVNVITTFDIHGSLRDRRGWRVDLQ